VSSRDRMGESLEPEWLERRDTLRAIDDWRLEGRLSLKAGRDGYNGTLSWEQSGSDIDFRFRGPFGFGGFRIHGDQDRLRLKTTTGTEMYLDDPEADMESRFGWSVPVYSMRYWIVGVSDPDEPASEIVDGDGLLAELEQHGWAVTYDGYREHEGLLLPRKILMEKGDVRIRMVADRWRIADAGAL
jgi:outer membrane lipoprotein LolB